MTEELRKSRQKLQDKMVITTDLYFNALENADYEGAISWSKMINSIAEDLMSYAEHWKGKSK